MRRALFSFVPCQRRHFHGSLADAGAGLLVRNGAASMERALEHHEQFVVRRESGPLYP
jgi:hypothetical protein